jgi:hypothetical protein
MNDNPEQFDKDGPAEFSDEATRRFFLGQLNGAEQTTFEERLFADDRLEARVHLAEFELADDYACQRLSAADRELFEQKFLVTADRRRRLRVSRALHDRFAFVLPAPSDGSVVERLRRLLSLDQPIRKIALAAVMLLVLIGTVWLLLREPRINRRLIATRPPATPAPTATPEVAHHGSNAPSAPAHEQTSPPMPPHEPPVLASVVLVPGKARDAVQIPVPQGERDIVRMQLRLERYKLEAYRVELLSSSGQSVFTAPSLKPYDSQDRRIEFDVPARLLKSGYYQVRLGRVSEGSAEGLARYYFRVQ